MENTYEVVILANGLFPKKKRLLDIIHNAPMLICCDGAASHLYEFGKTPNYVIGDMDSISSSLKELWKDLLIYKTDQNTNDLTKAVEFCIEKGFKNIAILGAGGLREDHALANISLLHLYLPLVEHVEMISDFGTFTPICKTQQFKSKKGEQVSIFSLTPSTIISTQGLKFPICSSQLSSWWEASLNQSEGEKFTIHLESVGKILVYQCF